MHYKFYYTPVLISLLLLSACSKWLNLKADKKAIIPATLQEFQALLDNHTFMNEGLPFLGELSTDDYYVRDVTMQSASVSAYIKNLYTWEKNLYNGEKNIAALNNNWNVPCRMVFYANVVLDGLKKISINTDNRQQIEQLQGSALFYRSFALYQLLVHFAPAYTSDAAAAQALGVPLRLDAGIDEPSVRAPLSTCYRQVMDDLLTAAPLLPATVTVPTRPSKAAAFALLGRMHMKKSEYAQALQMADSALYYNNALMNYNTDINSTTTYSFKRFNKEVIYHALMQSTSFTQYSQRLMDTLLYNSYSTGDLRKQAYYRKQTIGLQFIGSNDGTDQYFFGFATNELYLIKAEAAARTGNHTLALQTLNQLLVNRWQQGSFVPYTTANTMDALTLVIRERRKELVHRGLRWPDLKRLNKETGFKTTLKRRIDGKDYILEPGSAKYIFPLPDIVAELSGMMQNER